jgi:hypothetical protein
MAWSTNQKTNRTRTPKTTGTNTVTRSGSGVVDHALHDHAVHFIPWVVLAAFAVAGTLLHLFAGTAWSRAGTVALILIATLGLTYSVWMTQRTRTGTARWHGVLTAGFGGGWLAVCTITGFITTPDWWSLQFEPHGFTIATWAVGGAGLAAVWNTRIHARHRETELAQLLAQQQPEPTPMENAGHKGAALSLRRVNEFRSEGTLTLAPGDTLKEFQRDIASVETAHGYPPGSMTVTQRPKSRDSRICDVTVMHLNPIEDPQPWPGLLVGATK